MAGPFVFPLAPALSGIFCPAADHLWPLLRRTLVQLTRKSAKTEKDRKLFPQLKLFPGPRTF